MIKICHDMQPCETLSITLLIIPSSRYVLAYALFMYSFTQIIIYIDPRFVWTWVYFCTENILDQM